jgi:hypothetical protein
LATPLATFCKFRGRDCPRPEEDANGFDQDPAGISPGGFVRQVAIAYWPTNSAIMQRASPSKIPSPSGRHTKGSNASRRRNHLRTTKKPGNAPPKSSLFVIAF